MGKTSEEIEANWREVLEWAVEEALEIVRRRDALDIYEITEGAPVTLSTLVRRTGSNVTRMS